MSGRWGSKTSAGGGDGVAALDNFGSTDKISHGCTASDAFFEFLEGKKLPAIEILEARAVAVLRSASRLSVS